MTRARIDAPILLAGALLALAAAPMWAAPAPAPAPKPENLALQAKVSASSELNATYAAKGACDGQIAPAGGGNDTGKAWCAKGNAHPQGVTFTLEWDKPVTVAEVVYFGRTAFGPNECWKDYEVCLDGRPEPAAKGQFKQGHGPQRVKLAQPAPASRVTIRFLSHHGGGNPGAAEIQVYAASPPDAALGKFVKAGTRGPAEAAPPPEIKESPELAAAWRSGALGFKQIVVIQRRPINSSHIYTYHHEGFAAGGGLFVHAPGENGGEMKKLVDAGPGQIHHLDVSYDGTEILFNWRKADRATYQVHRINADGTGLTPLTDGPHHNFDACWLPDGGIAFLSTRDQQLAYCWQSQAGVIHRMDRDGGNVKRISANLLHDFTPAVLEDGRILYTRWEYVDRPAIPIQSLWTIKPDGTMLQGFFGNRVLDPATFIESRPIPGAHKILCTLTGHGRPVRGGVGIIDISYGDNAQEGIRNLTPEIKLRGVGISSDGPHGPYETPYPIDQKYFFVSHNGTILLRDYDGTQAMIALKPQEGLGYYDAQPIRPRRRPPVHRSTLSERAEPWATVVLQDVYRGLEPHVKRGEVKEIAVVQELAKPAVGRYDKRGSWQFQNPAISCGATYAPKKLWGFAPVEPDGSAHFKAPANTPIYFMALDAEGRAVQRMRTFTHLMPGEVQGCVGCHESRSETAVPRALLAAVRRPPDALRPPAWGLKGFAYAERVQPILDAHCVKCHGADKPPKGLRLTGEPTRLFNTSYDMLTAKGKPYTKWICTDNGSEKNILEITPKVWGSPASKLADVVISGHPDADGKNRVTLDASSRRAILLWIDLNVPFYGSLMACDAQPTASAAGARQ